MVPAGKGASLEVIEAKLTLEVFVHPLGAPTLLADAHDLLAAHSAGERSEQELRRLVFAVEPLGDEPERLAICERNAVIMGGFHAHEAEARAQLLVGSFAPGEFSKRFASESLNELGDGLGLFVDAIAVVETHDAQGRLNAMAKSKPSFLTPFLNSLLSP